MTTIYTVRRVQPADAEALREFYAELSAESRHARFLGSVSGLSSAQSLAFCTPDHMHAAGFVAVSERTSDRGSVIGHLCLEPAAHGRLELAVAVADAEQGRGIGRLLVRKALGWALARGYGSVVATCLADNSRVLSLLTSAPYTASIWPAEAGVVNVTIPLHSPLPGPWSSSASIGRVRQQQRAKTAVKFPCHAVWRRMPPPRSGAGARGPTESS